MWPVMALYARAPRLAVRGELNFGIEVEHLAMRQFDRHDAQAEFDKLVREIRRGCEKDQPSSQPAVRLPSVYPGYVTSPNRAPVPVERQAAGAIV